MKSTIQDVSMQLMRENSDTMITKSGNFGEANVNDTPEEPLSSFMGNHSLDHTQIKDQDQSIT